MVNEEAYGIVYNKAGDLESHLQRFASQHQTDILDTYKYVTFVLVEFIYRMFFETFGYFKERSEHLLGPFTEEGEYLRYLVVTKEPHCCDYHYFKFQHRRLRLLVNRSKLFRTVHIFQRMNFKGFILVLRSLWTTSTRSIGRLMH